MDTQQGAVFYHRFRPASMSSVLVMTFILGLGAGLSLSLIVAGTDHVVSVDASPSLLTAGHDMSAAAYAATHPTSIRALPTAGHDMSAAAYAATHPTSIRALPTAGPRYERRGLRGDPRQLEMTVVGDTPDARMP
jgi:hypothetical protein